jgi:hypothetical protein
VTICWSCRNRAADYLWVAAPSRNRVPLCTQCCGMWRLNARDEPDLAPETIMDLA